MTTPRRSSRYRSSRQSSSSSDSSQFVARTACFDRKYTTVFTGAPQVVAGPAAVLIGNVDNDPNGDVEIVVGGMDGTLSIFKGGPFTGAPFMTATGLGTVSALGLGTLLLGHNNSLQLIACTVEGVCHIFNIMWDSSFRAHETYVPTMHPLWSVPCPPNVTACCIADINGNDRQEVVMATSDGCVYVLSVEVNAEEDKQMENDPDREMQRTPQGTSLVGDAYANSDVYSSSSAEAPARGLTPSIAEDAINQAAHFLAHDEDAPSAMLDGTQSSSSIGGSGEEDKPRPIEYIHVDDLRFPGQDHPPAGSGSTTPEARATSWSATNAATTAELPSRAPLNPHLKTLLELKVSGVVTSLSLISFPGSAGSRYNRRTTPNASASTHSYSEDTVPRGPDDSKLSPAVNENRQDNCGTATASVSKNPPSGGGGDGVTGPAKDEYCVGGVYAAVGLESGIVQVMRLSSRRSESGRLDLISGSGRQLFDVAESTAGSAAGAAGHSSTSTSTSHHHASTIPRFFYAAASEGRPRADSRTGGESLEHACDEKSGGRESGSLKLDAQDSGAEQAAGTGGGGEESEDDQWWVPVDPNADIPLSMHGWTGSGLVVGLAPPHAHGYSAADNVVSATPTGAGTPLSHHNLSGHGTSNRGRRGGSSSGGRDSGNVGGRQVYGDAQRSFGVCTADGRVCCCRVVSTAGGLPQWKRMWARQTEVPFFAFHRMDYPNGLGALGHPDDEKETLLVACSWGGITFLFDAEGGHCIAFDPGPFLEHPVKAFVAGDVTTGPGTTEPCLVYVTDGGQVLMYHGLYDQAGPIAPQQFLPTILKDGTLDTLLVLVNKLLGRLRRRSNQADRLLPSPTRPVPAHTTTSTTDGPGSVVFGLCSSAVAITPNADASFSSPIACDVQDPDGAHLNSKIDHEEEGRGEGGQQTEDLPLCKADAILARALLCPAGAAYVFSMTRRRRKRAERAAVSDAGALCTGGRGEERERDAPAAERGDLSWVTVEQGVWAAQRVVEELTAWKRGQARGKDPSLKRYPCARGALEALAIYGSGSHREGLRSAVIEARS